MDCDPLSRSLTFYWATHYELEVGMIPKPVKALLLGACLVMPASYVLADDDDDERDDDDAPAMQVMIDEDGEILEAEDDSGAVRIPAGTIQQRGAGQLGAQTPVTYHADGSVSAEVGREHYKYLVIRIDEDGKQVVDHVPVNELPDFQKPAPVDGKEQ